MKQLKEYIKENAGLKFIDIDPIIVEWTKLHTKYANEKMYVKHNLDYVTEYSLVLSCPNVCKYVGLSDCSLIKITAIIGQQDSKLKIGFMKTGYPEPSHVIDQEFTDCKNFKAMIKKHILPLFVSGIDELKSLVNKHMI